MPSYGQQKHANNSGGYAYSVTLVQFLSKDVYVYRAKLSFFGLSLCSNGDGVSNGRVELSTKKKDKNELAREVLAALFNADERSDELPRRTVKTVKRSGFKRLVVEPTSDSIVDCGITAVSSRQHNNNGMQFFSFCGRLLFLWCTKA